MPSRLVTFGESLFRIGTRRGERASSATEMEFHLGGAELNVAANFASLGGEASWVSVIPEGGAGELIVDRLRGTGVDTSFTIRRAGNPGWYLLETAAAPRTDRALFRAASLMSTQTSLNFDWSRILKGATALHTTGITAGLSATCTGEVERAMEGARTNGALVSYDFNFRRNLWSLDEAKRRQTALLDKIDILFGSRRDLETFYEWNEDDDEFESVFREKNLKAAVLSHRNEDETEFRVDVVTRDGFVFSSETYPIVTVDRIGIGDAMAAGFLASYLNDRDFERAARFAGAAAALKYSIKGDMALSKRSEVDDLLERGYKAITR